MIRLTASSLAILLCAAPAFAQTASAPAASTPAAPGLTAAPALNPNLAVASVRMENGTRASKMIGAAVYADGNTQVGSIDDLIMTPDRKVVLGIVAVGGVLGVGAKLVAIPIEKFQPGQDGKLMLPGATKESLNAMPTFVYNG